MKEIYAVMIVTALSCSVLGSGLVLRKMALTADALSHSVLLGIVVAFSIVRRLDSYWLLFGAALFGLFMVYAVETLSRVHFLKKEDALGFVFPLFFALAVLILTRFYRNTHLDVDVLLMGNPLFTPFVKIGNLPRSFIVMGGLWIVDCLFLSIFYRPLLLSTFQAEEAKMQGIHQAWLYGIFMSLCSLTCVAAFESVGAILVISFFIAPACSSLLFARSYAGSMFLSMLFGIIYAVAGTYFGIQYNVSLAGLTAVISFFSVLILSFRLKNS